MTSEEFEGAHQLLELHIALVQDVVEFYMDPNLLHPDDVHNPMIKISRALGITRGKGLSSLRRELDKAGEVGKDLKGFLDFLEEFYDVKGTPKRRRK